ncbi:MAG: NfeD family protein [Planctomycetota bacterium]
MDPSLAWGLGLMVVALALLALEVFVPSGGVIGAVALIVAVAGLVGLYRADTLWGVAGTLLVVASVPTAVFFWAKVLPSTPIGRAMLGSDDVDEASAAADSFAERDEPVAANGATGRALTDLHPIGYVEIEGVRHDAMSRGVLIDAGDQVRVVGRSGVQLEVDRA